MLFKININWHYFNKKKYSFIKRINVLATKFGNTKFINHNGSLLI